MSAIRMTKAVWTKVHNHLYSKPGEHFAFLLARWGEGARGPVFLVHDAHLIPDQQVRFERGGYRVTTEGIVDGVNAAVRAGYAVVEVHNHGGSMPRFSGTDRRELPDFTSYMLDSLPGRPYAATVWGDDTVYGEWHAETGRWGVVDSITVIGGHLRQVVSRDDDGRLPAERFSRQLPWFTAAGQEILGRLRVAVVGAGGTGSVLLQNLAYLGVRDFVVIEHDSADETNMNRLVTATNADVGTSKAVLARRMIRAVAPHATVVLESEGVPSPSSIGLLKDADVIFGCVDDDGPRHVINAVAVAHGIPYIDLAVGIEAPEGFVEDAGGRLAIVLPGGPCLHCMGEVDLDEVRHWLRSPGARRFAEERGYVKGMAVAAPAVVSLNSSVSAAAATEFAMLVSGVRPVVVCTDFDVLGRARSVSGQWVTPRRVVRSKACIECNAEGIGDAADLERFGRRQQDPEVDRIVESPHQASLSPSGSQE